jgi:ATP-dependent helicase/DNAse subunit B
VPITLITGPANAGKAQVVLDSVRRLLAHGEEPLLIVPTRADAEAYLRELAGEGAAMGVRVQRFDGLIEEVVHRAGASQAPFGGLGRERLIAALLERHGGLGGAVGYSPGLVAAAGALLAELQVQRVSPARLSRALAAWSAADGPASVRDAIGRLFDDYNRALERMGRLDAEQRAVRALDAVRRNPALWGRRPVALYGFDDLTPLQIDTIETLGRVVDTPVTVSLTYEPGRVAFAGRASTFARLEPLAEEHRELEARAEYYSPSARPALAHLERRLFESGAPRADPGGAVRLLEGGGERAELELIARDIGELLQEGVEAEEIAVVMRSPDASAALFEEVFAAAGVPFALERRRRLGDSAIGRALIGLLRCTPAARGEDPPGELGDLLAWLRAPGLLERPEFADSVEVTARRMGAVSAARARALWEERHWRLDTIEQLERAAERGPAALIERAARELEWLFAAPRRAAARVLGEVEVDEARALSAGLGALGELRELARAAPELAPAAGPELARWLERVRVFAGERPAPGAVAVLDPLALRARRVRALFVCGLQEGVFPARVRPQPLLGEEERRRLAETSGLRLGAHEDRSQLGQLAGERYLLYAAVSRPRELLVLSWHVANDEGEPSARSLFVDDVCDLFDRTLAEQRLRRPLGAADRAVAGEAPGSAGPSGAGERAATLAAARTAACNKVISEEPVLAELRERPWSASSLEGWIRCPMRWFVQNVLAPGAFDPDPEPLARGGLAHAALADTLEGLRAETGSARVSPGRLALARELLAAALARNELHHPLSVAPERRPGVRRRLRADLERYLEHAAEVENPLEPTFLEAGFGIDAGAGRGEQSAVGAFEFAPSARLRGRIDRVDVSETGEAVVYDYKSSFAPKPDRWVADGRLQVALYMRAVEELFGLRVVGGFYQPLSGPDLRARGLLDSDSAVQLDCVRGDAREHDDVQQLLDEALAKARQAVAEAGRGEIESRPQTCAFGKGGCEFPTICRCER